MNASLNDFLASFKPSTASFSYDDTAPGGPRLLVPGKPVVIEAARYLVNGHLGDIETGEEVDEDGEYVTTYRTTVIVDSCRRLRVGERLWRRVKRTVRR